MTITEKPAKKFAPLRREPAYFKVYETIEESIVSGALPDGAYLPTEAELCEQFQVTRSTVREGLRLLQQTGLIVRGPNKKLVVARPSTSDVAQATSKSLALGGVTFREVWETLLVMYPPAARLAAKKLSKHHTQELKDIRAKLASTGDRQSDMIVDLAVEFFQALVGGLENRVMHSMLQSLNLMIGESLRHVIRQTPKARQRILKAQENLIAAIENRDEEQAEKWMARHIDDLRRGYSVAQVDLDARIL